MEACTKKETPDILKHSEEANRVAREIANLVKERVNDIVGFAPEAQQEPKPDVRTVRSNIVSIINLLVEIREDIQRL
jgi:hypothetical protein